MTPPAGATAWQRAQLARLAELVTAPPHALPPLDEALAQAALDEQVAPLVGARVSRGELAAPGRAGQLVVGAYVAEVARHRARAAALAPLRAALAARGVPVMALKGAALTGLVVAPGERAMADTDWLVPQARFAEAAAVLVAAGAAPRATHALLSRTPLAHERAFIAAPGVLVDLHARPCPWPLFQLDEATVWAGATPNAEGLLRPAPPALFVLLAMHAAQDGFELRGRHLLDGVLLVRGELVPPAAVVALAHAFHARRAVATFLARVQALVALAPAWTAALSVLAAPLGDAAPRWQIFAAQDDRRRAAAYGLVRGALRLGDALLGRLVR